MSTKPSLLFVDHEFHRKTRSFHFLIDILKDDFDLKTVYIDPTNADDLERLIDDSEYVVLAQMDFLTPQFIAAGKKVCVVQMYDGSAGLPDSHWQMNRQARYLNFSVALHARALAAGAESLLARYFPDPAKFKPVEDFSTFRGFFWQRLPKSPVNLGIVGRMAARHLNQLHVHTPADDDTPFDPAALEAFDCPVTTSDWFEHHEDFKAELDKANVYFAPRLAEGIGHGFLEALAKGMVVIAYDKPTHNEYINNWVTGILYDQNVGGLSFRDWESDARTLSRNARAMVATGHARWKASHAGIVDFVRGTPAARVPAIPGVSHALTEIKQAYVGGLPSYTKALEKFTLLRETMGTWDKLEDEVAHASPTDASSIEKTVHLFFGRGNARPFLRDNWSETELTHTWAIAQTADMTLPVTHPVALGRLVVDARALSENTLSVSVNGQTLGEQPITAAFRQHVFEPKEPLMLEAGDKLELAFSVSEEEAQTGGDARPLQFAIKSVTLTAVA